MRTLWVHALVWLPLLAVAEDVPVPISGTVTYVIDGDTVVLGTGEHVRLLDINTTEVPHNGMPGDAGSGEASAMAKKLVLGKHVKLEYGPKEHDVYNRLLAHLYLDDGSWVNGAMVESGWAHVYTFADNNLHGDELISKEDAARAKHLGLWALPRWTVHDAISCCKDEDIGRFTLVKGKVLSVGHGEDRTYLNFGTDYRTDFTVFIGKKDEKWFKKQGIKDLSGAYLGKTVLVRGFTEPVNGVLVHVTHPQQLEVMN